MPKGKENKKLDAHTALVNKIYAIRTLNKQLVEWTVAQKKKCNVVQASKPTTKQLLLTRYHDTMMCSNAAVPVATAMVPLPHPLVAPIT